MHTNLWFWIAFNAGVLFVLAIDLFAFQRKAYAPSTKEATIWTAVWVTLSLSFNHSSKFSFVSKMAGES